MIIQLISLSGFSSPINKSNLCRLSQFSLLLLGFLSQLTKLGLIWIHISHFSLFLFNFFYVKLDSFKTMWFIKRTFLAFPVILRISFDKFPWVYAMHGLKAFQISRFQTLSYWRSLEIWQAAFSTSRPECIDSLFSFGYSSHCLKFHNLSFRGDA